MNKFINLLSGTVLLEELESPINGKLTVVKTLGYGTYIQGGGLTQSGGVVKSVWKSTLKKVKTQKKNVKTCLILGLGGGSAAELVLDLWPKSKVTGVEIDPIFISLGKKYLKLAELDIKIVNEDASIFLKKNTNKYDLVLVDMYVEDNIPQKFEVNKFIRNIKNFLKPKGMAVFNRLYYDEKRRDARLFQKKLEKEFGKVIAHYPEANVMFICS